MRVISQDGFYDLPYENVGISLNANNRNQVIAWSASDFCKEDLYSVMGNYSTEEKAKKAMEMLRTEYAGKFVTNADISEDFNERLKELMKGGFGTVVVKETNDCRVEFNNLNGYFQFPADEDVEE